MNTKAVVSFVLVTMAVLIGVTALLWNYGNQAAKPVEGVAGDGRHTKGEGQVELVEFSDLQCPACRSVHEPLKQLLTKYEGKVKYVWRHFPLTTIHKNALAAAYAVEAANMQNKFWEMQDILFARQEEWQGLGESEVRGKFVEYAVQIGAEKDKFSADMDSQEAKDAVSRDLVDTTRFGLGSTPTFFVNGVETNFNQLEAKLQESLR